VGPPLRPDLSRLVNGQRESYRACQTCGLIFSVANPDPDARFCCPGHARRWAQTMTG
jgi:hypothetical protein